MNVLARLPRIPLLGIVSLLFSVSAVAAESSVVAYVANAGNNNVQLLDVGNGATLNKLYTGAGPWRLVKSPDGKKMIVQHWYAETSAVIDLATNAIEHILPVRGPAVYDPEGKLVWTHSWPATQLQALDAKTFKPVKQKGNEDRAVYEMVFWDGKLAKGQYDPVSKTDRRVFTDVLTLKLDDNPKTLSAFTPVGVSPARLVVDPTGDFLLTANYDDRDVSIINNLGDGRRITLARSPRDIVFNKQGKQMIVVAWDRHSQESDIFTLETNFKTRPWPEIKAQNTRRMQGGFVDAEMGPDGLLYVLDRLGGRLLAFDPDTLEEKKNWPVGDDPWVFTLRQVSGAERAQLAQKTKARRQVEEIIAAMQAKLPRFQDVSFTETMTQEVTDLEAAKVALEAAKKKQEEADKKAGKDGKDNKDKKPEPVELKKKTVVTAVKTQIKVPDAVRQETADGGVRLAQGGRVVSITKGGQYRDAPRQELAHVLYTAGSLSTEEVVRQLAGDIPGSPFLRNGIAVDVVKTVEEQGHKFHAIGALHRGEFVSQLWISADSNLPLDLVEQYPVIRAKNPHRDEPGFQGVTETKFDYHAMNGRFFPAGMTRFIDGEKLGEVVVSDVKFDQNLPAERFSLSALGGVLPATAVEPKALKGKDTGPGLAVESQGNEHIESPLDPHEPYNSNPPTSGPHTPYIAEWGVHKVPVPREVQVHNLEDGGVMVQYHCAQPCDELVKKLEAFAGQYDRIIVAPYPLMTTKIALTAWQRIETMEEFDEQRIKTFIEAYIGQDHHAPGGEPPTKPSPQSEAAAPQGAHP
ncbi:MAG: DUF3105 domain-containing protein [Pseudomonadota bacterium]